MQAIQGLSDTGLPIPSVQCFNTRLQGIEILARGAPGVAFACRHGLREADTCRLEHRVLILQRRFLSHEGDAQSRLHLQRAVIQALMARQDAKQRRFARSVPANQSHALAGFECEVGVIQQRPVAVGQLGVLQSEQSHEKVCRGRDGR